ncbi:MAG: toll/interleukin-1 receptor domain-containing protein [Bacteroidales bacterium]|nr:toll/interleukin-1 receptor domain-containing protein [Bacteroidales bacterium]
MPLFTEQQIRNRYQSEKQSRDSRRGYRYFSATEALNEGRITDSSKLYDIFLSHSSKDEELIAGLKLLLNDMGYSVYVDWNDEQLDPNHVTPETAAVLRERMKQCKSLIYAFSENASNSKWMPWELGYFDALKQSRVAVLPISKIAKYSYKGSEFVGLYYVVQIAKGEGVNKEAIWVHNGKDYVNYKFWLEEYKEPYKH